ncbi:MAG: hypothetical protein L0H84_07750 [Pseudonocardia sp.]|nr:hypothetical protein [Pseudonocardia sp.]
MLDMLWLLATVAAYCGIVIVGTLNVLREHRHSRSGRSPIRARSPR